MVNPSGSHDGELVNYTVKLIMYAAKESCARCLRAMCDVLLLSVRALMQCQVEVQLMQTDCGVLE